MTPQHGALLDKIGKCISSDIDIDDVPTDLTLSEFIRIPVDRLKIMVEQHTRIKGAKNGKKEKVGP